MRFVVAKYVAVEYTGTPESADEVMAAIEAAKTTSDVWTLKSSDASSITLHYVVIDLYGQDVQYPLGWIVCGPKGPAAFYPDETALDAAWYTVAGGAGV